MARKTREEFLKMKEREKDLSIPLNDKGDTMGYALDRVSQDAMYPDVKSPTDWTKGPGMMEINVRDYVKAAHSINPPVTINAKRDKKGSNYKAGQEVPAIEESLMKDDNLG